VRAKTEEAVRQEYGDLFDEEAGPGRARVIRALDAGFRATPLPSSLNGFRPELPGTAAECRISLRPGRWTMAGPFAAVAAIVLIVAGSLAAGKSASVVDLGKPTNDVSSTGFPSLDSFHRIGTNLHVGTKPEVLFLGEFGAVSGTVDGERWAIIKALQQFGSLSRVAALQTGCDQRVAGYSLCTNPTFDLTRARYRSKYIAFADREIAILRTGGPWVKYAKLSGQAAVLYKRYAEIRNVPQRLKKIMEKGGPLAKLPMVVIGNYLAVQPHYIGQSDLQSSVPVTPNCGGCGGKSETVSFSTLHDALVHDRTIPEWPYAVIDINSEANVITALICHADGKKPTSVCTRPAIKQLLKLTK